MSFASQLVGTLLGIGVALAGGFIIYGLMKQIVGIRLSDEDEFQGADLSIHKKRRKSAGLTGGFAGPRVEKRAQTV